MLCGWDISNPEAYVHYRRFWELQLQGRIHEAIAELEMAVKLDPLGPANHFTLGSFKGGMGAKQGNAALAACPRNNFDYEYRDSKITYEYKSEVSESNIAL